MGKGLPKKQRGAEVSGELVGSELLPLVLEFGRQEAQSRNICSSNPSLCGSPKDAEAVRGSWRRSSPLPWISIPLQRRCQDTSCLSQRQTCYKCPVLPLSNPATTPLCQVSALNRGHQQQGGTPRRKKSPLKFTCLHFFTS